ncbi:hypothetical protein F5Y02DRAFT_401960 [Annulohypoxylon stygium]|nr:hypothetical protein F5Y02DRAFT_401960 [Annulohypoxylon stygium]
MLIHLATVSFLSNFQLMFDPVVPARPTKKVIAESMSPAIAWVRVFDSNKDLSPKKANERGQRHTFTDEEINECIQQRSKAIACLMEGKFDCSH